MTDGIKDNPSALDYEISSAPVCSGVLNQAYSKKFETMPPDINSLVVVSAWPNSLGDEFEASSDVFASKLLISFLNEHGTYVQIDLGKAYHSQVIDVSSYDLTGLISFYVKTECEESPCIETTVHQVACYKEYLVASGYTSGWGGSADNWSLPNANGGHFNINC